MLHFKSIGGNHFELLVGGQRFVPEMLRAIHAATQQVLLECYLVASGEFSALLFKTLREVAERGVNVFVLFDSFGAQGLKEQDSALLAHFNIQLIWYNPLKLSKLWSNFRRNHRKLLVVDRNYAFVGGFGITDEFWRRPALDELAHHPQVEPWLDVMVSMQGPIVGHWQSLFNDTWSRLSATELVNVSKSAKLSEVRCEGGMRGRVAWANGHIHQGIIRQIVSHIRKARRRVYIATPYFVPSWRIRRALQVASRRGVDVRLLLPGPETDHPGVRFASWRYYRRLLRQGVKIFEYQPTFIHAKVVLCDDWASIGSCNLDHWNQRWNLEANVEVEGQEFAESVGVFFSEGFADSEEQQLQDWLKPYWHRRLLTYLWSKVDALLMRLG